MSQEVKILLVIGVVTVAILGGAVLLLGKSTTPLPKSSVDPQVLVREDSHKIASDSAKVTVVEFGDYQCPACGRAYPTTKAIIKDYSGKINFVFRNFPLTQHKNAMIAAEAAEAAGAQGKFWEMYDKLYETQNDWAESDSPLNVFVSYAAALGLDTNTLERDIRSNKYAEKITQDQRDGSIVGVQSTPTFFINGQRLDGVPTYNDFRVRIEAQL